MSSENVEEKEINTSRAKSNTDIFDRLAKDGIKASKIKELEKLKEEYELKDCTFKP